MTTKPILLNETGVRMADALEEIAESLSPTKTLTIIASADDGAEVVGQTIRITDATTGVRYADVAYEGQPVVVDMKTGFSYIIEVISTLQGHYVDTKPTGIIMQDTIVTFVFHSISHITTFPALKAAVEAGLARYIPIGWQVSFTHATEGLHYFDVMDYSPETESLTLCQHDTLSEQKQFDAPEALVYASSEMPAGAYKYKNGSTTYYFTLTKAVPQGGQIRTTSSEFYTWATPTGDQLETGSVSTTEISGATDLGTTGAGLLNHADRVSSGSNDYGESNLRQWLNATGNNWWVPQTMFDRPSGYVGQVGYLTGVPQDVLDSIDVAVVKCVAQNTYTAPDSGHAKGARYDLNDRFFLLSEIEVFGSASFIDGSHLLDAYVGAENADRIKYYGSSARYWWLRSPSSYAYSERLVYASGAVSSSSVNSPYGVAPACIISKSSI